jgi:hypothetical protein
LHGGREIAGAGGGSSRRLGPFRLISTALGSELLSRPVDNLPRPKLGHQGRWLRSTNRDCQRPARRGATRHPLRCAARRPRSHSVSDVARPRSVQPCQPPSGIPMHDRNPCPAATDCDFLSGGGEMGARMRSHDWSGARAEDPVDHPGRMIQAEEPARLRPGRPRACTPLPLPRTRASRRHRDHGPGHAR